MEKLIHISSGRGPLECALVVKNILAILLAEAKDLGLIASVLERNIADHPSGMKSVTVLVSGKSSNKLLAQWEGSVLWKGKSPFRPKHQRKNWFIEVFGLTPPERNKIEEKDVVFKATKSSGPSGQHVNKTSSAIRATHLPTGQSVLVQDSRSQHQNRKIALQKLEQEMQKFNQKNMTNFESDQWLKKNNVQRGNPSRIFEGKKFSAVLKT